MPTGLALISAALTLSALGMVRHKTALDTVLDPLAGTIRLELSLSSATGEQLSLVRFVDGLLLFLVNVAIIHGVTDRNKIHSQPCRRV